MALLKSNRHRPSPRSGQGGEPICTRDGRTGVIERQTKNAGRNNHGHVTTRHQGGGHKALSRDRFQARQGWHPAGRAARTTEPQRQHRVVVLCRWRASLHHWPKGVSANAAAKGSDARQDRQRAAAARVPVGTTIHCTEMLPGKGAACARAGASGTCWRAKVNMRNCVCVRAKSAKCM